MALQKFIPSGDAPAVNMKHLSFSSKVPEKTQLDVADQNHDMDVDIDLREDGCLIACYMLYPHIEKDHLVKLLKQLLLNKASPSLGVSTGNAPNAADVPTLLGRGSFSLLSYDRDKINEVKRPPPLHALASYESESAIFDRSGRYVITGSDDRLVKIWSMETAYCLASCRGHDGDITDLAVSSNNALVASSSNDCIIRVWRLPDGLPISVLRGHTGAVTAIAFSPRPNAVYQLLSSSDDGTCRLSDLFLVKRTNLENLIGFREEQWPIFKYFATEPSDFCCAFNANGTVFVTGSSDNLPGSGMLVNLVWMTMTQPNNEIDVLSGHENDSHLDFPQQKLGERKMFPNLRIPGKKWSLDSGLSSESSPPPMPPQPQRGGSSSENSTTPRGVNMIVWSLDNRLSLQLLWIAEFVFGMLLMAA
ncbi:WD40/YVTN repeat-like-containing domain superfamily [Sesbania bispinosa]|nr:WD40/YVTN repeat-like-containing domain superfamily [Sesbania bispinosa]